MAQRIKPIVLLLLLFVAGVVAVATVPAVRVEGAVGHPVLGTVNAVPSPGALTPARSNVTVLLGSMYVTAIDGAAVDPVDNLLTINFSGVTFSGSQFYLILSQNGLASQSAGDVRYSPLFSVSQFAANVGKLAPMTNANGTFWIGEYGASLTPIVVGPIPVQVTSAYSYIKVYDGNTGAEATASQRIIIATSQTVTTATTETSLSTTTSFATMPTTSTTIMVTTLLTTAEASGVQSVTSVTTQLLTQTRSVTFATTISVPEPTTTTATSVETTTAVETATVTSTTTISTSSGSGYLDYVLLAVALIVIILVLALVVMRGGRTKR